jgi:hypothetical protein
VDFLPKDWAETIKAASTSPLGIIALCVMAILASLCYLFRNDSARVKLYAFGALVGFLVYAVAIAEVPSKSETAMVCSGTLRNAGHDAVEGAMVTLTPRGLSPSTTQTGSDGFFSITLPKEARGRDVEVVVAAKSYKTYVRTLQTLNGSLPLEVPPLEAKAVKPPAPPPPPGSFVVSGRILADDSGAPVDHAAVTLLGAPGVPPTIYCDSEGIFSQPVKAKRIKIQVLANGFLEHSRELDLPAPTLDIRLTRKP